jgi:hypothetical protein
MTDEDLIAQAGALVPVYIDGLGAFRKVNGVLRCVGWVIESGAQLNLIVSLAGADKAIRAARFALDAKPPKTIESWNGAQLAH